jgi:hypothetical protein
MHRTEIAILRSPKLDWKRLTEILPGALEALGLVHDDGASDGQITVYDRGDEGCVLHLEKNALARRAARAIATRAAFPVPLFEVVGTSGGVRNRFRTNAFVATEKGELRDAEGKELDLEDARETWGGGSLSDQAQRVLEEFAQQPSLQRSATRMLRMGYRARPAGRPSTPRVATLLGLLKLSKSHEAIPQPNNRVELKIELAAGGKQTSYCSTAEHEELQKLFGS